MRVICRKDEVAYVSGFNFVTPQRKSFDALGILVGLVPCTFSTSHRPPRERRGFGRSFTLQL
jgi:hypothetical protein